MGNDFNCLLVAGSKSNQKKGDKSVGGFLVSNRANSFPNAGISLNL
jgi:hypothetical protein